jgi:cell division septation protein DedD
MKEHLETESLSAYLDGELDDRELSRVEQHLQSCAVCSAARAGLASAAKAIASLGPVTTTVDEHRALRQTVLKSRPSPATRRFGFPQWALAGSMVLIAVSALALSFLRDGDRSRENEALTEAGMPSDSSAPNFSFDEPADVDRTVESLPEVAGPMRSSAPRSLARDEGGDSSAPSAAQAPANPDPGQTVYQPPPVKAMIPPPGEGEGGIMAAPGPFSPEAGDECMRRVAATQPYEMVPLRVEEASYQGRPAWLLVYGWGPNVDAGLPPDRWQTWLVDPDDCKNYSGAELEAKALYRSFSP